MIPSVTCEPCYIRARYNAHKPGESTFYQCADVSLAKAEAATAHVQSHPVPPPEPEYDPARRALSLVNSKPSRTGHYRTSANSSRLYGFAHSPFHEDYIHYMSVDPVTGETTTLNKINFGLRSDKKKLAGKDKSGNVDVKFILEGILAMDQSRQVSLTMLHGSGGLDDPANMLLQFAATNATNAKTMAITGFDGTPINDIIPETGTTYITFSIVLANAPGGAPGPGK
jgi:hypothetical protein